MADEASNYIRVTEEARRKESQLESIGYLHSNYERFKDISNYDKIIYSNKLRQVADIIIKKQIAREQQIYNELGISGIEELSKIFLKDEGLQNFISSNFNNIYSIIAGALKDVSEDNSYSLNNKINKNTKNKIENSIQKAFDNELEKLSEDYKYNLNKIKNQGSLSENMVEILKKVDNRNQKNKMKTASEIARSALSQWKGNLLEQCLGMFVSQLGKIKGVKITGADIDEFGKFVKSDVTAFTDNMSIGFSAKNYKIEKDKNNELKLTHNLVLHGGGSFESLLKRIESLKGEDLNKYIDQFSKSFRSDNFYYNLINEAVQKSSFKTSQPAIDFMETVKTLAGAWFGTQLLTNTQEGLAGQNVDFLVISNKTIIPISLLLIALKEQTADIKVNISSKADLDEENIYEQKIGSPYTSEGLYSKHVQNIGFYAGQEVYNNIKIGTIKLNLILQELI